MIEPPDDRRKWAAIAIGAVAVLVILMRLSCGDSAPVQTTFAPVTVPDAPAAVRRAPAAPAAPVEDHMMVAPTSTDQGLYGGTPSDQPPKKRLKPTSMEESKTPPVESRAWKFVVKNKDGQMSALVVKIDGLQVNRYLLPAQPEQTIMFPLPNRARFSFSYSLINQKGRQDRSDLYEIDGDTLDTWDTLGDPRYPDDQPSSIWFSGEFLGWPSALKFKDHGLEKHRPR